MNGRLILDFSREECVLSRSRRKDLVCNFNSFSSVIEPEIEVVKMIEVYSDISNVDFLFKVFKTIYKKLGPEGSSIILQFLFTLDDELDMEYVEIKDSTEHIIRLDPVEFSESEFPVPLLLYPGYICLAVKSFKDITKISEYFLRNHIKNGIGLVDVCLTCLSENCNKNSHFRGKCIEPLYDSLKELKEYGLHDISNFALDEFYFSLDYAPINSIEGFKITNQKNGTIVYRMKPFNYEKAIASILNTTRRKINE